MNNVYDNGYKLLGKVKDIKEYLRNSIATSDMEEEIYDILKDIEEKEDNTILVINYDFGMSYTIEYWQESDKVV